MDKVLMSYTDANLDGVMAFYYAIVHDGHLFEMAGAIVNGVSNCAVVLDMDDKWAFEGGFDDACRFATEEGFAAKFVATEKSVADMEADLDAIIRKTRLLFEEVNRG